MVSRNVNSWTAVADDVNSSTTVSYNGSSLKTVSDNRNSSTTVAGNVNSLTTVSDTSNSLTTANDDDNIWYGVIVMYESDYVPMTYERTTDDRTTSEQIKEIETKIKFLKDQIKEYRSTGQSACELEKELDEEKGKMRKLKKQKKQEDEQDKENIFH